MDRDKRIKTPLESRERLKKRLKNLKKTFKEEKENEDAWPGPILTFFYNFSKKTARSINVRRRGKGVRKFRIH